MKASRLALLAAIVALVAAYFAFDLGRYLSLDYFKSQQAAIDAYFRAHPLESAAIYFAAYVAVTGLSLPGRGDHDARRRGRLRPALGRR